jgi:DNA excision repair protein ERCC-2
MFQAYANRIAEASKHVKGNVAVFFPSYGLLHEVLGRLDNIYLTKRLLIEKQGLRKEEKEGLIEELRSLKEGEGGILMGVQGGSLSEGIDYEDNLLSAVFVVGLPLSPPSIETEALKEYYMQKFSAEKGYHYSYIYPAINKVMQAAGRCIRSEEDKGVIILMDERFKQSRYAKCFPKDFKFNTSDNINAQLKQFFRTKE